MYTEIFREIVNIMHHDYAGCIDKKGWDNPKQYENRIKELEKKGDLSANAFVEIIQDYLLDFKDPHMFFNIIKSDTQKQYNNGFKVRRYENKLYITSTGPEKRLKTGDAIVSVNNIPVLELVEKHQRELMETKAERESWSNIVKKYNYIEIVDTNGEHQVIELKEYIKESYIPNHSVTRLNSNTLCMTLTDFFSPDPINELIEKHKVELTNTKNLIIDVRVNLGGNDASYQGLASYLLPAQPTKLDFSNYKMKFNCTNRNTTSQINNMTEELNYINDPNVQEMIKQFMQMWEENRGKGFVAFESQTSEIEMIGGEYPKNIIVLSDVYCGSAGDIFVNVCKQSPKVTVIGRPTMGVNDYANLTSIKWNNQFELMYPTSRLDQLDNRSALEEPGIKPDIYIPWTPEYLHKDIDMEAAMNLLQEPIEK